MDDFWDQNMRLEGNSWEYVENLIENLGIMRFDLENFENRFAELFKKLKEKELINHAE